MSSLFTSKTGLRCYIGSPHHDGAGGYLVSVDAEDTLPPTREIAKAARWGLPSNGAGFRARVKVTSDRTAAVIFTRKS